MKLRLGPETVKGYIAYYARCGKWPAFFLEQLRGVDVPKEMQDKADVARVEELERQAIRDTRPSGLLQEEEEEIARTEPKREQREIKRWEPDMTGVCPHCGLRGCSHA